MLRELGAREEALPALRSMALADPEAWLWAYTETADRAGQSRDATGVWVQLAQDQARPVALRRQLAFGLIERGARAQAEPVFRALAATAGPDSTEVRQLLFAWGQRPNAASMSWLEARARAAADGAEKAAWMRLLTERGGARNAVAAYRASGSGPSQGPARDAFLTALSVSGDRAGLAAALREELARQPSRERLEMLAGLAGQTGSEALEDEVQRALVLAGGGDPAMRRRVAFAAWRQGDAALAERLLAEHARATGGDAESLFLLGEMRLRQRDPDGARRWHEAALRRIGNAENRSSDARKMHAALLRRLGAGDRALPIYEALLAERPDDRHLRADLVSLLIEMRDFGRAQTVLAGR
jgi:TolA-binding protein